MLCWYLFESEDGWCIVHQKNILASGAAVEDGSRAKYWYNGKQYEGVVVMKHQDHDEVNKALTALKKNKVKAKKTSSSSQPTSLPAKRLRTTVLQNTEPGSISNTSNKKESRPKMTEEEKERQRILTLNKKEAEKRSNRMLLAMEHVKGKSDSDPEWSPQVEKDDDEDEMDDEAEGSDSSQDSVIADVLAHGLAMKKSRTEILNNIRKPESSASPTKEELKKQNDMLKLKLQMAYDAQKEDKKKSEKSNSMMPCSSRSSEQGRSSVKMFSASSTSCDNSSTMEKFGDVDDDQFSGVGDGATSRSSSTVKTFKDAEPSHLGGGDSDDLIISGFESDGQLPDQPRKADRGKKMSHQEEDDSKTDEIDCLDDEALVHQLYGRRDDTTELLSSGIYCKKDVLAVALTNSLSVKHFCRRAMTGVFIPSKIVDCTVTGQKWRAGGKNASSPKEPLHPGALRALVETGNRIGLKKQYKWPKEKVKAMHPVFSNRLIEVRKQFKEGKIKD